MATLTKVEEYYKVLHPILAEHCGLIEKAKDSTTTQLIINREQTRYLVITEGWVDKKHIHALIFDCEIRESKIWLHHDGLDHGVVEVLVAAGIAKSDIVLAFHPPHIRKHTGYGIG